VKGGRIPESGMEKRAMKGGVTAKLLRTGFVQGHPLNNPNRYDCFGFTIKRPKA
jgi:hypothetical protein